MLILKTITGSRLYGFAHADSDFDEYIVDTTAKTGQSIVGKSDVVTLHISNFVQQVGRGVPQAMEALYSPIKWVHDDYAGWFAGMEPDQNELIRTYRRTIRHFVLADTDKHRRHAMRLTINLAEWWNMGSFNPTLYPQDIAEITEYAKSETLTVAYINDVAPVTIWDQ